MTAAQRLGSPRDLFMPFHWKRLPVEKSKKTAIDKLMISEVMSFVGSDSCQIDNTKEKRSGKLLFSEYLGFPSNALEFSQSHMLGRTSELVEQDDGRKSGVREAEFQERIQLNLQFLVSAFPTKSLALANPSQNMAKTF